MKTKTLAIGLFPERIDVILCSGTQAVSARRIRLPLDSDPDKWQQQVRDAAKSLQAVVRQLGAAGLGARVFYRGPGSCAEFASPRAKTPSEAASAAILSCSDSLSCPIDLAACRAMMLAYEKHDAEPRGHLVVAADADDALTAICEMVRGAGLKFISATPIDAPIMANTAKHALAHADQPVASLYFGEHRSFLVIVAEKRIVFSRSIAVGLDALITSLTRPMRLPSGQSFQLSHDAATSIVHQFGFPSRSEVVHESPQIHGGNIVPLLQPVLQRFMVELRQSMRFALSESQREHVTLRLLGPGSRTPGFTQILADELGWTIDIDERFESFDHREPMTVGSDLVEAMTARRSVAELALEPLARTRKRRQHRMQRWLWTGAAASLAMIGFDAMRLQTRVVDARKQVASLRSQKEGIAALKSTSDRLIAASNAMIKLEDLVRAEVGARVHIGAVLQELSRITPPSIRLHGVTFKPGSTSIIGSISGYALVDLSDQVASSRLLESYMQQLAQSPLMHKLALANVQTTQLNAVPAQSFDISFDAVASPIEAGARSAVVAGVSVDQEQPR